uniref:G-protein coupled receptors family 3 profile domain-containing protein n=1 Tax=Cyclophora tenuis TaxID=216820 RepID=A0A7S1GQD3_CYCTE|mmetsp:Transcript_8823/g.14844  ORF Transcript_8823/g.14844 Transcript_8823/m.14844 type:complete len:439 (+) Transcript_8823:2-1318(+)
MFNTYLYNISFQGATGFVKANNVTGTREPIGLQYAVMNGRRDDAAQKLRADISGILSFPYDDDNKNDNDDDDNNNYYYDNDDNDNGDSKRTVDSALLTLQPFVYFNGSTVQPPQLPPLVEDYRRISDTSRALGLAMCGLLLVMSVGWAVFTFVYRKRPAVKVAQPPFLYMTCAGTFCMGLSILPMSFQEPLPTRVLDIGCTVQLWLLSIGFTTSFSALFCKMWRLNKVMNKAKVFRRVSVKAKDILYPFLLLLGLNATVLVVWMSIDPLRWVRRELEGSSTDRFGRWTESIGRCQTSNAQRTILFFSLLFLINFVALLIANVESYRARDHPTEFHETQYVALSMLGVLELAIIGLPILFLLGNHPDAQFLVTSVLVALLCLLLLLPTFVPKFAKRKHRLQRHRVSRLEQPPARQPQGSHSSTASPVVRRGSSQNFLVA